MANIEREPFAGPRGADAWAQSTREQRDLESIRYWRDKYDALNRQHRGAVDHLRKLAGWGWGENAPDDAVRDWREACAWLDANGSGLEYIDRATGRQSE